MYGLKKEVFNDIINVIKKYENIELAKSIINLSKKQRDFVSVIKYKIVLNKLKRDIIELKKYSTYVMTIPESEMSKVSDEMLKYELIQTIRDLK